MQLSTIWDAISLLVVPVVILPPCLFLLTQKNVYARITLGALLATAFIAMTRVLPWPPATYAYAKRPDDAANCSTWNTGGSYTGQIGMPSGHVLLTAYVAVALTSHLYSLTHVSSKFLGAVIASGILVVLMAISRVKRRCHTLSQVIVGGILGTAGGVVVGGLMRP